MFESVAIFSSCPDSRDNTAGNRKTVERVHAAVGNAHQLQQLPVVEHVVVEDEQPPSRGPHKGYAGGGLGSVVAGLEGKKDRCQSWVVNVRVLPSPFCRMMVDIFLFVFN